MSVDGVAHNEKAATITKIKSLRQVLFRAQNTDEITLWSSPHVRRKLSVMLLLARDIVNGSKYKDSQQKWAEIPENAIRLVNNVIIQITRPNSTSFHYSAFLNLHCLSVAKGFFCIRRKLHWGYLNFFILQKGRSHLQQFNPSLTIKTMTCFQDYCLVFWRLGLKKNWTSMSVFYNDFQMDQ